MDVPLSHAPRPERNRLLVPLDQLDPAARAIAGGKAASLARLIRADLPVPPGVCITTAAFRRFLAQVPGFDDLAVRLDAHGTPALEIDELAADLRHRLGAAPFPGDLRRDLLAWLGDLPDRPPLAVRSSATAEDSAAASFAGQHDTLLNVHGPAALLDAVRCCWISLLSDRAVQYRHRNRLPHGSVAMAVIVQEMVAADAAGVIFTADPVSRRTDRMVIEAVPGLGEALVSGRAAPDHFLLAREPLEIIERRFAGRADSPDRDSAPQLCLNDPACLRLAALALQVESLFGAPQDIEFAVRAGEVYLLQSRPITTPAGRPACTPTVWCNANVGEVLPDVMTPISWAVMESILDQVLKPLLRRVDPQFDARNWIALQAGRAYANLSVFVDLLRSLPGPAKLDLHEVLGGHHHQFAAVPPELLNPRRAISIPRLLRLSMLGLSLLLNSTPHSARTFTREWSRRTRRLVSADPASMDDHELARHLDGFISTACRNMDRRFGLHVLAGMVAGGTSAIAIYRLTQRWLDDPDGILANRLLAGAGRVDSVESGLDLARLADWVRTHERLTSVILERSRFDELQSALCTVPAGAEFLQRWSGFMHLHGHHTRGEADVHNPRWSECPDEILANLQAALRVPPERNLIALHAQRVRAYEAAQQTIRRMPNPLKRWLLQAVVRKAGRGLALRENMKSDFVRLVAAYRRILQEIARRLLSRARIADPDDVFFLLPGELSRALLGQGGELHQLIASRRAIYSHHLTLSPPAVIIGDFDEATALAPPALAPGAATLTGLAVSPGVAVGPARIILHADPAQRVLPGEILVAPFTDPGWTPYFVSAVGIVMDMGGQLSHGSIIAREYGIPAVVNVGPATQIIRTGQRIRVDGNRGIVTIEDSDDSPPASS